MNKSFAFWLMLLSLAVGITNCKKTEQQPPQEADWEEVCDSIPPSLSIVGYERRDVGLQYRTPVIFPSSPNKLLVFRYDYFTGSAPAINELVEYDFSTKIEKLLIKDRWISHPQVNQKGEIIFFMPDFNIYVYQKDTFKHVITFGESKFPIWNYKGDKYSFLHKTGNNPSDYVINNSNNTPYDTIFVSEIDGIGSFADINEDNIMCCEFGRKEKYGVNIINLNTKTYSPLYEKGFFDDGRAQIHCVRWHPNKQYVYYSDGYGLFRINVATKQKETVVQGCDTHWYHSFSFTPDGKYIYINRINYKKISETLIHSKSRIYKMTDEGKNIELIF